MDKEIKDISNEEHNPHDDSLDANNADGMNDTGMDGGSGDIGAGDIGGGDTIDSGDGDGSIDNNKDDSYTEPEEETAISQMDKVLKNITTNKKKLIKNGLVIVGLIVVVYFATQQFKSNDNPIGAAILPNLPTVDGGVDLIDGNNDNSDIITQALFDNDKKQADDAQNTSNSYVSKIGNTIIDAHEPEVDEVEQPAVITPPLRQFSDGNMSKGNTPKQVYVAPDEDNSHHTATQEEINAMEQKIIGYRRLVSKKTNASAMVSIPVKEDINDLKKQIQEKYEIDRFKAKLAIQSKQEFADNGISVSGKSKGISGKGNNGISGSGNNSGNKGNNANKSVVVRTGDLLSARLLYGINSDYPSSVIAEIIGHDNPKLNGAIIVGNFKHSQNSEKVSITFTSIELSDGKRAAFSAVVIDPNSDTPAVADDVDNHYISRFALPFLLDAVALAGDTYGKILIANAKPAVAAGGEGPRIDIGSATTSAEVVGVAIASALIGRSQKDRENLISDAKGAGISSFITGGVKSLRTVLEPSIKKDVTVTKDKRYIINLVAQSALFL